MHIAEIKDDDSGTLEIGLFYSLEPWPDEDAPRIENAIYSLGPGEIDPLEMRIGRGRVYEDLSKCPLDKTHRTGVRFTKMNVALRNGPETPIARWCFDYTFVVRNDIFATLGKTNLKGLRGLECNVVEDNFGTGTKNKYWCLCYDGKDMARMPVVIPPSANKCPFCGHEPLVCPGCGHLLFYECPRCKRTAVATRTGAGNPEFDAPVFFHGTSDEGIVLDASRWDGTDFLACRGGYVVTRRVVSALLELHAFAFRAIPLRTYFGSCTKEKRAELDELRDG